MSPTALSVSTFGGRIASTILSPTSLPPQLRQLICLTIVFPALVLVCTKLSWWRHAAWRDSMAAGNNAGGSGYPYMHFLHVLHFCMILSIHTGIHSDTASSNCWWWWWCCGVVFFRVICFPFSFKNDEACIACDGMPRTLFHDKRCGTHPISSIYVGGWLHTF